VWHSSQAEKGSNFVGFVNAEADRIMDDARLEFDEQKRFATYHRFHAILHEEQPYTFLFCIQSLEALDRRFQNVKVYKFGLDSREWWVPANLQRYH
jgi:peptide/nickel transport system substrate-binding protein